MIKMVSRVLISFLVFITLLAIYDITNLIKPVSAAYGQGAVYDQKRTFEYVIRKKSEKDKRKKVTKKKRFTIKIDSAFSSYLTNLPAQYCNGCTLTQRELVVLDDADQRARLAELLSKIRRAAKKPDDRARVAISLVQKIPYDYDAYFGGSGVGESNAKYPYEVLYQNKGICSEKTGLLVLLLKELGFGTAEFVFSNPLHEVAAVKCPIQYSYMNTGYCFLETNWRTIPTYSRSFDEYPYQIIPTSDGRSMTSIGREYHDAVAWKGIIQRANQETGQIAAKDKKKYNKLIKKYGL